jgi:hypothetical protein
MRKTTILTVGVILCLIGLAACAGRQAPIELFPRCTSSGGAFGNTGSVTAVYQPTGGDNCVIYLPPFDQAGWWESRMNSRRLRGQEQVALGCSHCPGGNLDCESPNNCSGCSSVTLYFDMSRFPDDSRIAQAKLAIFADKPELAAQAIVEGRVNVGGDYQVISENPQILGNWVLFDVTPFACRGVYERRNSVSIDLSLPCGDAERAWVAMVGLGSGVQPTMIVEYK